MHPACGLFLVDLYGCLLFPINLMFNNSELKSHILELSTLTDSFFFLIQKKRTTGQTLVILTVTAAFRLIERVLREIGVETDDDLAQLHYLH